MAYSKTIEDMRRAWDEQFPEFAPNEQCIRRAATRCVNCAKPWTDEDAEAKQCQFCGEPGG